MARAGAGPRKIVSPPLSIRAPPDRRTDKAHSPRASHARRNTMSKVQAIPEGMHSLTPHLVCCGAAAAIAF